MFSKQTGAKIEELILIAIIVLNIADFFEILDPFWDFIKKIISWVLIGILFYQVSISDILLGVKNKFYDLVFVIAAFCLSVNDMLSYAAVAKNEIIIASTKYFSFIKETVIGPTIIENVTQGTWTTLSTGMISDAITRMMTYAPQLTANITGINFIFQYGGQEASFSLVPNGLNGTLLQVYNSLLIHASTIEFWGIVSGMIMLTILTFWATLRIPIKKPSFIGIVHEGYAHGAGILIRLGLTFFGLMFFFLFVFSLIMEWLAIAIDAPILMLAIGITLILIWRGKHFDIDHWVKAVSDGSSDYYEKFIALFHDWKNALLGISGLLVLHILTEIANFLLPFVMPVRDALYLSRLGPNHDNLLMMAINNLTPFLIENIAIITITFLVIIGWFFLLTFPGYIWYKIFRIRHDGEEHHPKIKPWVLALFFSSITACWKFPLIKMKPIYSSGLIGVDMTTHWISTGAIETFLLCIGVFILIYAWSMFKTQIKWITLGPILISTIFLGVYAFYFFTSSFNYYIIALINEFSKANYSLGLIFIIFLIFNLFFYASSYLFLVYEIIKD